MINAVELLVFVDDKKLSIFTECVGSFIHTLQEDSASSTGRSDDRAKKPSITAIDSGAHWSSVKISETSVL